MEETLEMMTVVFQFPPRKRGTEAKWPRRIQEILDTLLEPDSEGCEIVAVGIGNQMADAQRAESHMGEEDGR